MVTDFSKQKFPTAEFEGRSAEQFAGRHPPGNLYGQQLPLPNGRDLAWDIYFVYAPGVRWEDELPEPTEWMHQLGRDERHLGNGDTLRGAILKLLGTDETIR